MKTPALHFSVFVWTELNLKTISLAVFSSNANLKWPVMGVYHGVKTYEDFLCFVASVRVRAYYVDSFVLRLSG